MPSIASLTHKEGKVTLYIKPDTQLFNVKIADDIARELRIKPDRPNTGELVDVNKIAFHNVDTIFMTCDQAKSRTFIDNREADTILSEHAIQRRSRGHLFRGVISCAISRSRRAADI